jgi:glycosidase
LHGAYKLQDANNTDVFAYTRSNGKETVLVILNFRKEIRKTMVPNGFVLDMELINNLQPLVKEGRTIVLQPYQACIIKLKPE